jgi:hypothetical protein
VQREDPDVNVLAVVGLGFIAVAVAARWALLDDLFMGVLVLAGFASFVVLLVIHA